MSSCVKKGKYKVDLKAKVEQKTLKILCRIRNFCPNSFETFMRNVTFNICMAVKTTTTFSPKEKTPKGVGGLFKRLKHGQCY